MSVVVRFGSANYKADEDRLIQKFRALDDDQRDDVIASLPLPQHALDEAAFANQVAYINDIASSSPHVRQFNTEEAVMAWAEELGEDMSSAEGIDMLTAWASPDAPEEKKRRLGDCDSQRCSCPNIRAIRHVYL